MGDKSDSFNLDDLARQLAQSLPKNLRILGGDIERNFRALLQAGLEKMDLVTREEFDVQSAVLERTREKLEKIDSRLRDLEQGLAARKREGGSKGGSAAAAPSSATPSSAAPSSAPAGSTAAPTPGSPEDTGGGSTS
jgi:BMFP domain-containing protein YqiC